VVVFKETGGLNIKLFGPPKETSCMEPLCHILHANFGDDQLGGFWVAGVEFPPSPQAFIVALTTLGLLCMRVRDIRKPLTSHV